MLLVNIHMYEYMFLFLLAKTWAELPGLTFLNFNFLRNYQLFCKVAELPQDILDPGCLMWFTKAFQSSCSLPFHLLSPTTEFFSTQSVYFNYAQVNRPKNLTVLFGLV